MNESFSPRPNVGSGHPRRPLFEANREEKSMRRRGGDGQARRRLLLGFPEEAINSTIDGAATRGSNVVARLMGLDSLPVTERTIKGLAAEIEEVSSSSSSSIDSLSSSALSSPLMIRRETGAGQQLQLQELLRIKEPLLLHELLRETDDHHGLDHPRKGSSSLVGKLAGLVRRNRVPAMEVVEVAEGDGSKTKKMTKRNDLLQNGSKTVKVSPIKSPSKNKRGFVAEAAVKMSESDDHPRFPQQSLATSAESKLTRRRLSLNRSSSEPTLSSSSSSTSSFTSRRLAKLSESIRHKFGSASSTTSSSDNNSASSKTKNSGNLVRSKSDLGFQQHEASDGSSFAGIRKQHKQHKQHPDTKKKSADREEDHTVSFSRTGKLATMKNSNGILSYTTNRLFGNNRRKMRTDCLDQSGKDQPGVAIATSDTARPRTSDETSSLMRALLRRSRRGGGGAAGTTKQAARSFQSVGRGTSFAPSSSRQSRADDNSLSSMVSLSSASSSSSAATRFYDDVLSDDSSSVARSESSPTNPNFECVRPSRTDGGQPSPVSVLEPPFVDEIQTSPLDSGGEDSPGEIDLRQVGCRTCVSDGNPVLRTGTASTSIDGILNAILDISRIRRIDLSSIGLGDTNTLEEEAAYIEDVLATSQLLCSKDDTSTSWWLSQDFPIDAQVFSILETSHKNARRSPLHSRKLLFDCVEEAVESRFGCFKRWYLGLPAARSVGVGLTQVGTEVEQQISAWRCMVALSTDELVEKDMSIGAGKWTEWNEQVELIAADVECSILRTMMDELVWEWSGPLSISDRS